MKQFLFALLLAVGSTPTWAQTFSAAELYTLENTTRQRGYISYDPEKSSTWLWTSGKAGATAYDTADTNFQWAFVPTGEADQYYLYNVGACKFAIPQTGGTSFSSNSGTAYSWAFSSNAVALKLMPQDNGTYKIKTVNSDTYISISEEKICPVINYNDEGSEFTITKVGDADEATASRVSAAMSKLIINQPALNEAPTGEGWYAIRVRSHASFTGHFVFTAKEEILDNGTKYPLDFYTEYLVRPATDNAAYFFHIERDENQYYWQLPCGKHLTGVNNKFPVSTANRTAINLSFDTNGFRFSGSSRYAVPYYLRSHYFIGETANSSTTYYDLYPIDLDAAGMVAWKVVVNNASETTLLRCTRSDVSGCTAVFNGGYFFLPADVVPESSDFAMEGIIGCTIDREAKTITAEFDPKLALLADGVTVAQGYQTTGRGNSHAAILRITLAPFNNATDVTLEVSLKDDALQAVSSLSLYELPDNTAEFNANVPATPLATMSEVAELVRFPIGTFVKDTPRYLWLTANVKEDAALGAIIDAALDAVTYTCNDEQTTLELGKDGDPEARGLQVHDVQSHVFLPTTGGSSFYRIPALVTAADGSLVAACDKRYGSSSDIGGGHVIDIVTRRSTDGGRTWSAPLTIAKGDNSTDATCGYGDPSLTMGRDGKLYCLFAAGNTGYFYGLNRICMATSEDNGVTWSTPVDLYEQGHITDHTTTGLYDYFVTSGKGLYTSDGILMYLMPAQPYTNADRTTHQSNSNDYLLYSTDDGATWHIAPDAVYTAGDEAKLIEKSSGQLLASVRQANGRGFNTGRYTLNADGTITFRWGTQSQNAQLHNGGSANNQDILYYSRKADGAEDIMLHSMTTSSHANLKLYMSRNAGSAWKEVIQIQPGGARYVVMTKLANGDVGLLYEDYSLGAGNVYPINFITLTRQQILDMFVAIGGKVVGIHAIENDASSPEKRPSPTVFYDLSGRRVNSPTRGIYMVNGKKVVVP